MVSKAKSAKTVFNIFMWISLPVIILPKIMIAYNHALVFDHWWLSEFMVNYEGGFIRRGLLGQLLYYFSSFSGLDPRYVIIPLCIISFLFVLFYFIKQLNSNQIWWWIIPFSFCFGLFDCNIIRKDYIIFACAILCFIIYNHKIITDNTKLLLITLISILALNIHEAAFFIYMPFLWLFIIRDENFKVKWYYKYMSAICIVITMLILIKSTGNYITPYKIQESWHNLFPDRISLDLSRTIKSMSWDIHEAMVFNDSILIQPFYPDLFSRKDIVVNILVLIYLIVTGVYIISHYPYIASKSKASRFPCEANTFLILIICELICQLPMILGLSCDFVRIMQSICLIPFFMAWTFNTDTMNNVFGKKVLSFAQRVYKFIPCNIYILILLLLTYHVTYARFELQFCDPFIGLEQCISLFSQYCH